MFPRCSTSARCPGAGRLARPRPRCYARRCLRRRRQRAAEGTSGWRSRRQARGRCYTSRVQIARARFRSSIQCLSTRIIPFAMRVVRSRSHAHLHAHTHLLKHARACAHVRPPGRVQSAQARQSWTQGPSFRQRRQGHATHYYRMPYVTRMGSLTSMCSIHNATHSMQGATDSQAVSCSCQSPRIHRPVSYS